MTPPRKPRLSQHFLCHRPTAARIADALGAPEGARVLEVGPGRGALTEHLLDRGWDVTAVELDSTLAADLESRWGDRPNFRVVRGDALEHALEPGATWWVIGNLPYAITSPLLFHFLDPVEGAPVAAMVFMVQREVAERLAAAPGTKARGALTVGVRLAADVERLFDVPPGRFRPPPTVTSSVVRLTPIGRAGVDGPRRKRLRALVQGLFGQRRKQIQKSLRTLEPWGLSPAAVERVGREVELDLGRRPETLSIEEWLALDGALADEVGEG
ncbi:MAG TPA: 16S rRNA (adenine(1518)-N(6)/adenine(1519)-N(6))-dimethyltransferase RsmA [Gemmatimonadota bacterium]|nr:16S rRNA (adenine(1518)-N(6)/adenine(1519)-N(6))-dimethyltransferase RsmA [Gemmatimonadota bacterium]